MRVGGSCLSLDTSIYSWTVREDMEVSGHPMAFHEGLSLFWNILLLRRNLSLSDFSSYN